MWDSLDESEVLFQESGARLLVLIITSGMDTGESACRSDMLDIVCGFGPGLERLFPGLGGS